MSMEGHTRRLFVWSAGGAVAAPLAATAATAATATDPAAERLARLEDEAAIRELQTSYLRRLNAGACAQAAELFVDPARSGLDAGVRRLAVDLLDAPGTIQVAPDRLSALARLPCTAHTETPIEPRCTLVEMARAQGEGVVRRAEPCVLETALVKRDGAWRIERAELRPA